MRGVEVVKMPREPTQSAEVSNCELKDRDVRVTRRAPHCPQLSGAEDQKRNGLDGDRRLLHVNAASRYCMTTHDNLPESGFVSPWKCDWNFLQFIVRG